MLNVKTIGIMETILFDVMKDGKFIMQFRYTWAAVFKLDLNDVLNKLFEKRPSLKGAKLEPFQTNQKVTYKHGNY